MNNENIPACEKRWINGVPFYLDEFDVDSAVQVRHGHNCRLVTSNGKYFILNLSKMKKEDFLNQIQILYDVPTEDGTYTWLIYSNDTDKFKFAACKTESYLEIGTSHRVIAYKSGVHRVHAGGEMRINNDKKIYNFYSGTYMRDSLNKANLKRKRRRCSPDELEDVLIDKMKHYLGKEFVFFSKILMDTSLKPTVEELKRYEEFGAEYELFDDVDDCRKKSSSSGGTRKARGIRRRITR
jgi:hypothetical protein